MIAHPQEAQTDVSNLLHFSLKKLRDFAAIFISHGNFIGHHFFLFLCFLNPLFYGLLCFLLIFIGLLQFFLNMLKDPTGLQNQKDRKMIRTNMGQTFHMDQGKIGTVKYVIERPAKKRIICMKGVYIMTSDAWVQ